MSKLLHTKRNGFEIDPNSKRRVNSVNNKIAINKKEEVL